MKELTKAQTEQSARGPAFSLVKPSDIHGPKGNFTLSNQIFKLNPKRWYDLLQEHMFESGAEPRPLSYYA